MIVSIITATYNSAETIVQTIDSLRHQSYTNVEHIIIDGNSRDDTVNIIKSLESPVDQLVSEPDKGIYDAMNKGIRLATGDIIGLLNSDDFYHDEDVLKDVVEAFEETDADIVYGNTLIGYFDGKKERISRFVRPGQFGKYSFIFGWMPSHVSVYIRKSVYDQYGLFDPEFRISGDYELMIRFMHKYKVKCQYINRTCLKFRVGGASTGGIKSKIVSGKESYKAWKKNDLNPYFFTIPCKFLRGFWNILEARILPIPR